MGRAGSGVGGSRTLVDKILSSRPAAGVVAAVPVPLLMIRRILLVDNAKENGRDGWARLRSDTEADRYAAVRAAAQRYAADGFILDVGCSQGILQEGLEYRRYVGVDNFGPSIQIASARTDAATSFLVADAETYVPDEPPDATVLNEVIYYLRHPVRVVEHHARQLADDGVVVLSIYARSWSSRRLLRTLNRRLRLVESSLVTAGHLSWTVAVYRPHPTPQI